MNDDTFKKLDDKFARIIEHADKVQAMMRQVIADAEEADRRQMREDEANDRMLRAEYHARVQELRAERDSLGPGAA